jgi:very-short-patch-repair endonuclease
VGHPRTAFASHFTAARVQELPVPTHPKEHVSVFHANDRRRTAAVECHVATRGAAVLQVRGVRISRPDQTFIELASQLTLVDLIVVGDAIVAKKWLTADELDAACERSPDKHARTASCAARYVREGVDSPMETRLRMLIVLAGLPEPTVNFTIRDDFGKVVRRLDLSYPGLRVMVEYDGRQHAESPDQYASDVYRREEFDRRGWRIVTVTSEGIYRVPEQTLMRVRDALKDRGATGLPARLSDAWRPHFPGYPSR